MDWSRAIERNHDALIGIVAALFAMLGLTDGGTVGRIPRELHRSVLRLLRPVESAVRRLIVIAARGLTVKLPPSRPKPTGVIGRKRGNKPRAFPLFDRRKRFAALPHESQPHAVEQDPRGAAPGPAPAPKADAALPPDGPVDARHLCLRLQAIKLALEDLPRQAKRLARWRARRETMASPKFKLPLRPGPPPGHRRKPRHEVDFVLRECHGFAWDALRTDTS